MGTHHLFFNTSVLLQLVRPILGDEVNIANVVELLSAADAINYDARYDTWTWTRRPLNQFELRQILTDAITTKGSI